MAHFYRHLKAGKSAARAIREAQLALKTRSTDPIFWAPFQLTAGR
jgi:CHAT domain-containing protein